jgi:hypothetical protein
VVSQFQRRKWLLSACVGLVTMAGPAVALLGRGGALVVHPCVPGDGLLGWMGLRLAILRPDVACPAGTFSVDGLAGGTVGLVVIVALPLLATHLASLAVTLGLAARLHAALRVVRLLLATAVRRLPASPSVRTPSSHVAVLAAPMVAVIQREVASPWRRGPPLLTLA